MAEQYRNSDKPSERGARAANERMQLTWLLGAPNRPVSVHQRVLGRRGLGSSATQLMRAVRLPPPGGLRVRRCRLPGVADARGRP